MTAEQPSANLSMEENAFPQSGSGASTQLKGLELANHLFGPLLSPVTATEAQWSAYTENRQRTSSVYRNVLGRPSRLISKAVQVIEQDMGLENGTLRKCVSILARDVSMDDDDPRDADNLVRIYSPSTPKYIDVHIKYHCRPRYYEIEWFYSLGYKIHNRIRSSTTGSASAAKDYVLDGCPSTWHTRNGWQPLCWGYFDDADGNYGERWRRVEQGALELWDDGVLDVFEVLFGPIDKPPVDDEAATLAYRRKLVLSVRFLFAAVGIDYRVACTDDEEDERPDDYMLEGISDKWVARGIRKACGFQLKNDPEEEKRGQEEREEEARGEA